MSKMGITAASASFPLQNTTQVDYHSSPSISLLVVTAFLGFTSFGGLLGNGLVVCVIKRLRCHGKYSSVHTFLMHLALSDILVCCVCIPLTIFNNFVLLDTESVLHNIMCKTMRFFQFLAPTISISILTVISVDRYLAIVRPLTKTFIRRPKWLIIFAWTYSIVQFSPTFFLSEVQDINIGNTTAGYCTPIPNNTTAGLAYLMVVLVFSFILPYGTILVMYANVVRVVWIRHQDIAEGNSSAVSGETLFRKSKKKIVQMLLVVVAAFLCCWLPFTIYCGFIEPYFREFPNPGDVIRIATYCLGLFNSFINPFIYFYSNAVLRKSCIDLICCRKFSFPTGLQYTTSPALSRRLMSGKGSSLIPDVHSWRFALSRRYGNSMESTLASPNLSHRNKQGGLGVSASRRHNSSPLLGLRSNTSPLARRGKNSYKDEDDEFENPLPVRKMPTKTTLEGLEKVTGV